MRRIAAGIGCCLVLVALPVGFGVQFNGSDAYPDATDIDENYAAHVGERVHLWGVVAGERDGSVVVSAGTLRLTVSDIPPSSVDSGDGIQVYGELRPNHRLETRSYHVQTPSDRRYMYGVSLVGIALAAVAFLRHWRVDLNRVWFTPREND
ncbi:hypothetical protein [Haloplanus sp.]|uniref:hypothetical protein n=1 Tax=Haloplanus sp. TaxID=1961696 RepID=UPI00262843F1|nr:hypothetical protein [Haloplanus sp.]